MPGNPVVRFDTDVFSFQSEGGISRYFAELLRHLPRQGIDARIFAPAHMNRHLAMLPFARTHGFAIPAALRNGASRRVAALLLRIADQLAVRLGSHDLLHLTYYRRRYPTSSGVVTTVVDMIPELFPEQFRGWNPHPGKLRQIRESRVVLAISDATRRDILRLLPDLQTKVVVTPLAVDVGRFEVAERRPGVSENRLLYVGRREGYKNFEMFSRAAARILERRPSLRLLCVGGGAFSAGELAPFVERGCAERVRQRSVAETALPRIYAESLALIVPSLYEGFGLPVLEAFAGSCPAVLSDAGALPEVAGDAALYFRATEEDDLERAVEEVLSRPELRKELRSKGRDRVREFSWERTAEATARAYRSVLAIAPGEGA